MLETALERQDALELTDDQVTTLEELQTAVVAAQEAARTDMQSLRDRLQEEGADRVRIREEMMDLRERLRASHAPFRSQLGETLTLEQGWILMDAMRENRQAVRGGRAGPCAHDRMGPARGRGGVGGGPARGSRGGGPGGV
jgi:Spy/CpxP family protein refolding chaperone